MSTSLTPRSRTLIKLGISPDTVCAVCPNAVWHQPAETKKLRVFCTLMHVLVDGKLSECDGLPDETPDEANP